MHFEILGNKKKIIVIFPDKSIWFPLTRFSISASNIRWNQEARMLAKREINKRNMEMNCSELTGEPRLCSNLMTIGWYSNYKCNIHVALGIFSTGVKIVVHSKDSCKFWCHIKRKLLTSIKVEQLCIRYTLKSHQFRKRFIIWP